uniref:Uncharacterized protein n=1 Tax=Pyramimonas obovata TaxID=1411642 RepID=A0A7S0R1R9_9CHLO|mmetsp:Transcript_23681/g.51696  ORF Transcript_23681/g.51696 Transcript_23681/m.51696 type:complete len:399 (+) Transcript_23681:94-1290(+)|eukprot:CAMPEP_0118931168 /NCGR_PEP_ID=MMETSP1169-20130426/7598_1 /TAXON_ID=36882 /ORGANISM="Pyramimonas obovata, Strain CCMP722" /LENGTH=398 /DNA_ID=CAMNT_0006873635 /DNA_START=94 /DNA_END=1290 /DNA_ORIENTATION=-
MVCALSWSAKQRLPSFHAGFACGEPTRGAGVLFSRKARTQSQRESHAQLNISGSSDDEPKSSGRSTQTSTADPFGKPRSGTTANPFAKSSGAASNPFATSPAQSKSSPFDPFSSPKRSTATTDPFSSKATSTSRTRPKSANPREQTATKADPEDCIVFEVPEPLRAPESNRVADYVKFYSLEQLFPGSGLADKFDTDAQFRESLHQATRDALFVPSPKFSKEVNDRVKSAGSTLCVAWTRAETIACDEITKVFAANGVNLDGSAFVMKLGLLIRTGTVTTGSLTDIVGIGRNRVNHSWHQDSGLDQVTLMMGFPAEDGFDGPGVFSHVVKLSHPLLQIGEEGSVIQWDCYDPVPAPIPEECIMRPVYRKGKEVMVYRDCDHLHSAPDEANRKAVWRFM